MQLARYLNRLFKKDGFILIDANLKKYIIGTPEKKKPIELKLLEKNFIINYYFALTYILEKRTPKEILSSKMEH